MQSKALLAVLVLATGCASRRSTPEPLDVVLEHGEVVDGTGAPRVKADVGVRGERIVAVGDLSAAPALRRIDVAGHVVTPGFIDLLDTSDLSLLADGRAEAKIRQGITTVLDGEGDSVAPLDPGAVEQLRPFLDRVHLVIDWTTLEGYWERLRRARPAIRLGTLVGATSVRASVLGRGDVQPGPVELRRMEDAVASGMAQGAFGVGSSLPYPVSRYAQTDELVALARAAGTQGGFYATHLRDEGDGLLAAVDEAIEIGRRARVPVEIWHLKVWGPRNWGRMPTVVARIEAARAAGLDVSANVYPYVVAANRLWNDLPPWALEGGVEPTLRRLRDPAVRARVEREIATAWDPGEPDRIVVSDGLGRMPDVAGKTVREVARSLGTSPESALVTVVLRSEGTAGAFRRFGSEADLRVALAQPWTAVGLDWDATGADGPLAFGSAHPRGYGTTARILGRYVREERLLTLEEAVRKMTSLPARRLGTSELGTIRVGALADLVVLDPPTVIDTATFEHPRSYPPGFELVLVNGQVVLEHGVRTDARPGGPLRRPGSASAAR